MQNLSNFLRLSQTFNLKIIIKAQLKKRIKLEEEKVAYSIVHETQYYDSYSYKSEIRVLKDMALVDLLSLRDTSLKRELDQLKKLKVRFKVFWINFHRHYSELQEEYPSNFIFSVRLD